MSFSKSNLQHQQSPQQCSDFHWVWFLAWTIMLASCAASVWPQVVQGMLLTRPGFEERVKGSSNMQEMLKWLPSDLFRTSLARVRADAERQLLAVREADAFCNAGCSVIHQCLQYALPMIASMCR